MPATAAPTFKSIMDDLKARKFRPVYFLHGDEAYYIDLICDYIADHVLAPEERDFNQTVFFGSDVTASQVADAARRYPMMADYQVVIVKEAQNLKQTDALEKYMKNPLPSTILVICHKNGKLDGRKREYVKTIQSAGILFESSKLRERDLPSFIEGYVREKHATIDPKSVQLIAESIGADLSRLTSELDKLIIALTPHTTTANPQQSPKAALAITPQLVEDHIGISKDFNGFELRDALVSRNVYKANLIINYFDKNPKTGSIYALLPMIFNYFQNLMLVYYCPQRNSQEAVAQWLDLRSPWAAKDYMTGSRNYTAMKVLQIIGKLREIDAKTKGLDNPNTSAGDLMKELIFYILH